MLVYFFSITYGIYLATVIEFFRYTNIIYYPKFEYREFDYYIGRSPGFIFDMYVYYEHKLRLSSGYGLLKF